MFEKAESPAVLLARTR
jgi:hypothetical protein